MTGFPLDDVKTIDTGKPRSINDVASLSGVEFSRAQLSSIKSLVRYSPSIKRPPGSLSNQDIFDAARAISDALRFAVPSGGNRAAPIASISAALVMGYYNENHKRMELFRDLIQLPLSDIVDLIKDEPCSDVALLFRQWNESARGKAGSQINQERFLKCLAAITSFCAGRSITRLYATKVPARYKIPELSELVNSQEEQVMMAMGSWYKTSGQCVHDAWGMPLKTWFSSVATKVPNRFTMQDLEELIRNYDTSVSLQKIKIGKTKKPILFSLSRALLKRLLQKGSATYVGVNQRQEDEYVLINAENIVV